MNRFLRRFFHAQHGNVLMLAGGGILILILVVGMGLDLGRQQLVRSKLQHATDAAALAIASMPISATDAEKRAAGLRVFHLNYPDDYMGVGAVEPTINLNPIEVTVAQEVLNTSFTHVIGTDTIEVGAHSVVKGQTKPQPFDIVMVLDESTSMSFDAGGGKTRVQVLKETATMLANKVFAKNDGSRIGVSAWSYAIINPQLPLTDSQSSVLTAINSLIPNGGTDSGLGLRWARDHIANGFTNNNHIKTVILLTDGANTRTTSVMKPIIPGVPNYDPPYKIKGVSYCTGDDKQECPKSDAQALDVCQQFKNDGVVVYTIALGPVVYQRPKVSQYLSSCATPSADGDNTDEYFFPAATSDQLKTAFDKIFDQLNQIRLSE